MRVVQDSVKRRHKGDNFYKPLVFLTISQSVPETLNKDLENSSLTSSSDGCCNDTSDRSVPKDSILTDDLQLNWPALTPKLTKKVKR